MPTATGGTCERPVRGGGSSRRSGSRICLSLTGASLQQNAAWLRRERRWVDLVELRADFLAPAELAHLARFPALVDLPVILTLRRAEDGGRCAEADRRRLLREALAGAGLGDHAAELGSTGDRAGGARARAG
jgi:hypothetical protein